MKNSRKKNKDLLFISQYRTQENHDYKYKGRKILHSDYYMADKKVIIFLSDYCKRKKTKLIIAGTYDQSDKNSNEISEKFEEIMQTFHVPKAQWNGKLEGTKSATFFAPPLRPHTW